MDKVTRQSFFDLGFWLSEQPPEPSGQQARLLEESHFIGLVSLANEYWLLGALVVKLKEKQIFPCLPDQFQEYLSELELVYKERALSIQQEVVAVVTLLQQNKIETIALKGAAHLFNGVAEPISIRFMSDIDLLVPQNDLALAEQLFLDAGYQQESESLDIHAQDHHHAQAMIKPGSNCYVELHRLALKRMSAKLLATEQVWQQKIPLKLSEQLTINQLMPSHQFIHSIAHSEMSDRGYQEKHLNLRQIHNLVLLTKRFERDINWTLVKQHFTNAKLLPVLEATLFAAKQLFNLQTPLTTVNPQCQKQFDQCLARYVKQQGGYSRRTHLMSILRGYSPDTIYSLYGDKSKFAYLAGCLKHFKRHLILAKYFLNQLVQPKSK